MFKYIYIHACLHIYLYMDICIYTYVYPHVIICGINHFKGELTITTITTVTTVDGYI